MKATRFFSLVLLTVMTVTGIASGQGMLGRQQRDPGQEIAKLFGKTTAFTANSTVTMKDASGKVMPSMEIAYAMLDGKVRTDMDMTKLHGGGMTPEAGAQMKRMGMDRMSHIFVPDKKVSYLMYPGLQSYCEINIAALTGQKESKEPKIDKTEIGKETVDGHPCVKSKVIITSEDGKKIESLVWQATDLKDFPVKSEMTTEEGMVITTQFKDINQSKPSASLFEPPSDFKKYDSIQEMMMGNMQRMMPPGGMPQHDGTNRPTPVPGQ